MESSGKNVSAFDDQPFLSSTEEYYYSAFCFLSASRNSGMGISGISIIDMCCYYKVFYCSHSKKTFCNIINSIDSEYIQYSNDKNKK